MDSLDMLRSLLATTLLLSLGMLCNAQDPAERGNAKSNGYDRVFTYSVITAMEKPGNVLKTIQLDLVPEMQKKGAHLYSIWIPPAVPVNKLPDRGNFTLGLAESQLGLMLAWPQDVLNMDDLDAAISVVKGVNAVQSLAYDPIYLVQTKDGFGVPTGPGFYVQREAQYPAENVDEAVRLSEDAWKIYDPLYGTQVIGPFRERNENPKIVTLYRIVWYPDLATWNKTGDRLDNRPKVREVRQIFRKRTNLRVKPGRGPARATDRVVPAKP
jgi:hypothetical protein